MCRLALSVRPSLHPHTPLPRHQTREMEGNLSAPLLLRSRISPKASELQWAHRFLKQSHTFLIWPRLKFQTTSSKESDTWSYSQLWDTKLPVKWSTSLNLPKELRFCADLQHVNHCALSSDVLCPNMKVQPDRFKPNSTSYGLDEVPGMCKVLLFSWQRAELAKPGTT